MENLRITYLTERYLSETATAGELKEFFDIVNSAKDDTAIQETLEEKWLQFTAPKSWPVAKADRVYETILRLAEGLYEAPAEKRYETPVRVVWMKRLGRISVAAAVILIAGFGGYFFFNRPVKVVKSVAQPAVSQDIQAPAVNQAMIVLADGRKVYLDSAANGSLIRQGEVNIVKLGDGRISYQGAAKEMSYNTLFNPSGSKVINIVLADGSKVWLNAASSITYPTAFTGAERRVRMTGEAYFEIRHDVQHPFHVDAGGVDVEDIGTRFNVNAYSDEEALKTTLVEGAVKVGHMLLSPGEQAVVHGQETDLLHHADTTQVLAWKNGRFVFAGAGIREVMREMARWYNVRVVYQGDPGVHGFTGAIPRSVNLSEVLAMLGYAGIHFTITQAPTGSNTGEIVVTP